MHGTLLGWHFNQQTLPWDTDVDVSVLEKDVPKLVSYASVQRSRLPGINVSHDTHPRHHIEFNVVHITTGVYTDITSLRVAKDRSVLDATVVSGQRHRFDGRPKYVMKSSVNKLWGGHIYTQADIHPLQRCLINNVSLWCPSNVSSVLQQEYPTYRFPKYRSAKVSQYTFQFDPGTKCWTESLTKTRRPNRKKRLLSLTG